MDNSAASDTARNETADSLGEPIKLSSVTETDIIKELKEQLKQDLLVN